MMNCAVIIPAFNPTISLIAYVKDLLAENMAQVIVVNDGSKEDVSPIFDEIKSLPNCTVLTHKTNKGKGKALKTAFQHVLQYHPNLIGVVTADADGQHSIKDVCLLAQTLLNSNDQIILGVRDFSQDDVPTRSLLGNRITSLAFQLFFRYKLEDTQTGLRGIPKKELDWISNLKGDRFEYEMNMLVSIVKRKVPLQVVPIETLYFHNNASSHFHSIIDSLKIFSKLVSGFLNFKEPFYYRQHSKGKWHNHHEE